MTQHVFRLPDLGEGTVSAEIVAWRVQAGDVVTEGQPVVDMSTEKAVVEVLAPVSGRVVDLAGEPGEVIAVGAELMRFDTESAEVADTGVAGAPAMEAPAPTGARPAEAMPSPRVLASPATRRRAQEAGVDLSAIAGSGPEGRIRDSDLEDELERRRGATPAGETRPGGAGAETEEIALAGVRRVIAQRMAEASRTIPHYSYVEEVDITELDALRRYLNARADRSQATLTYLPFIITALVRAVRRFPQCNALYDAQREVVIRHRSVHVGIATQTPDGLKVPVLRHAERQNLGQLAGEIRRLSAAARTNKATRAELSGSTITVTSLGKLGGIVATPIINAPEVAIIGINKAIERPAVRAGAVTVRLMMNLSSSFDHRVIDGFDAAAMIQALKEYLEQPATMFMQVPELR